MLIKAIGAFIVFFSCAACGLYLSCRRAEGDEKRTYAVEKQYRLFLKAAL